MRVLVWITCRNYECYLDHCVSSVKRQTEKVEFFVHHDACGGDSPEGVAVSRNAALRHAKDFDYVIFLDADDYLPPNYVEELLKAASSASSYRTAEESSKLREIHAPCVVACAARLFGAESRVVSVREPVEQKTLLAGNTIHVSALIPFGALANFGGFDPSLESHEDWDLWCKLLDSGVEFRVCHQTHLWYRRHAGSRSETSRGGYRKVFERVNARYGRISK